MFYMFRQNNSGGSFIMDNDVDGYVIVEATNAEEANTIAQDKGIYFDGCSTGDDCSCCGDRWNAVDESDGEKKPMIYDRLAEEAVKDDSFLIFSKGCIIYYKNGKKKILKRKREVKCQTK